MNAESAAWAKERKLDTTGKPKWYAEMSLDVKDEPASQVYFGDTASRFHLKIYASEWGYELVHGGKHSHVRIVEEPFVHGHDDFKLLKKTPKLAAIAAFLRELETKHGIAFKREHAFIRTNLKGGKPILKTWLGTL
jgi:hypothetical protein